MNLKYLNHYSQSLQEQVKNLIVEEKLHAYIKKKYPKHHEIKTDGALYQYIHNLKKSYLKNASQVDKVKFDHQLDLTHKALGLNTAISRVQGHQLQAKKEIRIASLFKKAPADFLKMIVVHELAHLKEREHNKSFYQLCLHMQPNYHQIEFDLRVYLTGLEISQSQS